MKTIHHVVMFLGVALAIFATLLMTARAYLIYRETGNYGLLVMQAAYCLVLGYLLSKLIKEIRKARNRKS